VLSASDRSTEIDVIVVSPIQPCPLLLLSFFPIGMFFRYSPLFYLVYDWIHQTKREKSPSDGKCKRVVNG